MLRDQKRKLAEEETGAMPAIEREMIERMTRMEVTLANHQKSTDEKFETVNASIQSTGVKVDEMYKVLTQAKGAKMAITIGLAGIGGIIGAKLTAVASAFGIKLP